MEATTRKRPVVGEASGYGLRQRIGLFAGPALLVVLLLLDAPAGMSVLAWRTAAIGIFMAVWWITEAVPIPATALTPLLLFPLLGVMSVSAAASPYANPVIYLFFGGFIVALAMQRHQLHRRIALGAVRLIGIEPGRVVLGVMAATAFISMWVSNTATAVMMLPIGLSIVELIRKEDGSLLDANFALTLMLGIAYASTIGGVGTLIGTPPNALLAAFVLETYGQPIGFAQWLLVGVPLVVVSLPLTWVVLTRVVYPVCLAELPGGHELIEAEYRKLGPMSRAERAVAVIFVLAAVLWIVRPVLEQHVPGLSDTGIAIAAALATFLVPVDMSKGEFLLDWDTAEKLPWGVLVMFGGGLSLADAVSNSGLAQWIGTSLGAVNMWPALLVVVLLTTVIVFLSEVASNTATAATFLPLVGSLAVGLGKNPLLLLIPATLAASCAFMLPVGTPPNAIVYGSGYVTTVQMSRVGFWLNLLFIMLITVLTYTLVLWAFGVQPDVLPAWARPR